MPKKRLVCNETIPLIWKNVTEHIVKYYDAWGSLAMKIRKKMHFSEGQVEKMHFPEEEVKTIILHISRGLAYIHEQKYAHLDIKPSNILISNKLRYVSPSFDTSNEEIVVSGIEMETIYKIGDLGHLTSFKSKNVEEGDIRYLDPEIFQGKYVDLAKADIFSLGITIYQACTLKDIPKNGVGWIDLQNGKLEYVPNYSEELNTLIKKMANPSNSERPTAADLEELLNQDDVQIMEVEEVQH
ncbi:wee1-like protein kinase 2 [Caerostris extrusa]|uniref:Wee1-like protein kinase 2 n=1 Tax=Caerostris extrusa TaxID=172846 RepID=A0AAV4NJN2_CAEEX|nr:wee1-like protein kinase 2 [Caerostris extrusa]